MGRFLFVTYKLYNFIQKTRPGCLKKTDILNFLETKFFLLETCLLGFKKCGNHKNRRENARICDFHIRLWGYTPFLRRINLKILHHLVWERFIKIAENCSKNFLFFN